MFHVYNRKADTHGAEKKKLKLRLQKRKMPMKIIII